MIPPTEDEKRKSILLVDDKAFLRRILRDYLEQQPNWVVCGEAEDGVDAIVKAQQLRPDLIVLDFSMPVMNGLEAAKHLKSLLPETPIVMFTTFDSPHIEKEALAAGIDSVKSKSDQTALLQCIRGVKYPNRRSPAVAEGEHSPNANPRASCLNDSARTSAFLFASRRAPIERSEPKRSEP